MSNGILAQAEATARFLRVMTYNIYKGAKGREAGLLAIIRAVQPDILFLQEVAEESRIHSLAEQLGFYYAFAASHYGPKNLALLSRYPLLHRESHLAFPLFHALLLATIQLPTRKPFNLYGVHVGVLYDWWRTAELRTILQRIRKYEAAHPSSYSLMAGDFNAILPGDAVNLQTGTRLHKIVLFLQYHFATRFAPRLLDRAGWIDGYRTFHPHANGFTFPATAPAVRLDHIYTTPTLATHLTRCEVVTAPAETKTVSDHLPLMAEFEFGTNENGH